MNHEAQQGETNEDRCYGCKRSGCSGECVLEAEVFGCLNPLCRCDELVSNDPTNTGYCNECRPLVLKRDFDELDAMALAERVRAEEMAS